MAAIKKLLLLSPSSQRLRLLPSLPSHPYQILPKPSLFSTSSSSSRQHQLSQEASERKALLLKKQIKRAKKKQRETPVIQPLTVLEPAHCGLQFAFRHSYTEIPKVKPIAFQEKFSPFGPGRLNRPWDGQEAPPVAPKVPPTDVAAKAMKENTAAATKKKKNKVSGAGCTKVRTREEILGEPLTKEEISQLLERSFKTSKQLNIGRDGLTHNMLINFYNYWQRDSVIRVKCKGVATVDMDNIIFQIEDKTGGKVIHRAGGTLHVFRGRHYTKRDRPDIPLMLWKPHSPIYPKLITQKPGGLKLQEANALRKRGRQIMPLCRLSKNGYYADLVQHVREAFEDDDLVRIDCKGLNTSDYKKIGAKLRDMVPCILLSFQGEQIILWKGRPRKVDRNTSEQHKGEVCIEEHHDICKNACKSSGTDDDTSEDDQNDGLTEGVSDTDDSSGVRASESLEEYTTETDDDRSLSEGSESVSEDISDTYYDSTSEDAGCLGETTDTGHDSGLEGSE